MLYFPAQKVSILFLLGLHKIQSPLLGTKKLRLLLRQSHQVIKLTVTRMLQGYDLAEALQILAEYILKLPYYAKKPNYFCLDQIMGSYIE